MKRRSAALAKVTRPIAAGTFPRERLFAALDEMRHKPVVWVSGPPGFGKTTLLASYLDARSIPCLWYQLDEGDANPATFFYYMGLAAKEAAPRKRKPLPLLTPEYLPGISTFTRRYFEDVYDRLKDPCVLVFDDFQEVPAQSPFHDVIRHGLSQIPEGTGVILLSRREPPPALMRLRANRLMEIMGWDKLRLTLEECEGIVRLLAGDRFEKETIEELHDKLEGWAAGLVLILTRADLGGIAPAELIKYSQEDIFDYFVGEAFEKMDGPTQDFLLKTAFLPRMTAQMAQALTGVPTAGRKLSELNRNHFFTQRRYHSPPAYHYHALFREFLLNRARVTFSKESLSDLRRHAASLLEDAGEIEEAMALLSEAGDWGAMIELIMKHAPSMLEQGRNQVLEASLEKVPEAVVENTPWIFYWKGACRLPFEPSVSKSYFEQAFEQFKTQEDTAGILLAWSGIVEAICYEKRDYAPLDRWIGVMEEFAAGDMAFPSEELEGRLASSMFAALAARQPHHPEIETWAQRALSKGNVSAKAQTYFHLANLYVIVGRFDKAALVVDCFRQLTRSPMTPPLARITAKYIEGVYHQATASHEECIKVTSEALHLARTKGVHVWDHMLLMQQIASSLNMGDLTTIGDLLEKIASTLESSTRLDSSMYYYLKSRQTLLQGRLNKASHFAKLSLEACTKLRYPFASAFSNLWNAQIMHALGKHGKASKHLARVFKTARETKAEQIIFQVLLSKAHFALDRGQEESGMASLRQALTLGKRHGYLNTFMEQTTVTARLCVKALEAGIEEEYVHYIIRKRGLVPDEPPVHLENWPWALKIYTLGRFSLQRDGKPVESSRKAQQKPLALLKALIAYGGRDAKNDQIADALWPEADGDMTHQAFDTTLHRLRKFIGYPEAVKLRHGLITMDPRYCWVDVWAFERYLGKADALWKKEPTGDDKSRAVRLTQKAVNLYRGHFLAGETDEPWGMSLRERLRSKFLKAVQTLGHYLEDTGQWEQGLELYQRGLELDDITEGFYQRLMICHERLGERTEALAVYDRCKKTLLAALGVEPSAQTETIRASLLT